MKVIIKETDPIYKVYGDWWSKLYLDDYKDLSMNKFKLTADIGISK